jgi:hypothetical protein
MDLAPIQRRRPALDRTKALTNINNPKTARRAVMMQLLETGQGSRENELTVF